MLGEPLHDVGLRYQSMKRAFGRRRTRDERRPSPDLEEPRNPFVTRSNTDVMLAFGVYIVDVVSQTLHQRRASNFCSASSRCFNHQRHDEPKPWKNQRRAKLR